MSIDWLRLGAYVLMGILAVILLADVRPRLTRWAGRHSWAWPWMEPLVTTSGLAVLVALGLGPYWFVAPPAAAAAFAIRVVVELIRSRLRQTAR